MSLFSGERMKSARMRVGLTQRALADALGLTQPQISRYENNYDEPGRGISRAIAAQLNVSEAYLYGEVKMPDEFFQKPDGALPIYESVCAGGGAFPFSEPTGYMVPPPGKRGDMWVKVRGDSMVPKIYPGELVLVDVKTQIQHGDIVVAVFDGEAIVKFFQILEGQVVLSSADPALPLLKPNGGEQFRVVGKVTGVLRFF